MPSAQPSIICVAPGGSDASAGTIDAPLATIAHAVAIAKPGDTIYVRGGEYRGPVNIWNGGAAGAPLHIMAYPGERVIIDGTGTPSGTNLVTISAPHVIFQGFEVTNSSGAGICVWSTDNVQLLDNVIHGTQGSGIWVGSDSLGVSSQHLIENNVIFDANLMNRDRALDEGWPVALAIATTTDTTIQGNIVFQNYGEGIGALSSTHIRITNNVAYDNYSVQMYLDNVQDVTVSDNLLFETGNVEFYRDGRPGAGILIANEFTQFEMLTTRVFIGANTYSGVDTARYDGTYGRGGGMTNSVIELGSVIAGVTALAQAVEILGDNLVAWWTVDASGTPIASGIATRSGAPTTTNTVQSSVTSNLDAIAETRLVENLVLTGTANVNGTGNALANRLTGNAGNNVLNGGLGNDTMIGGAGNDTFIVDSTDDRVFETTTATSGINAGGIDTVQSSMTFNLDANAGVRFVENLVLTGTANINGTGNALANRLTGNAGKNVLNGGLGNDTMIGGAGNDTYIVDSTGDRVFETTTTTSGIHAGGIDTVQSSVAFNLDAYAGVRFVENLVLTGAANINGTGNALANRLTGNAGNNVLNGGLGNDIMIGGAGNDTFVFNTALGVGNIDRIKDFNVVDDTIRLDDAIFLGLATGTLAASAFAANLTGQAATASNRIIYETDTGGLYYDSDGTGGAARVQFASLTAGLALTNTDFFVF